MSTLARTQILALRQAAQSAIRCEQATGLPAELTIAQWILESSWGAHQPGNNCFGIKAYEGCFGVQELTTTEVVHGERVLMKQSFATFPTLDACFTKHAALICDGVRYRSAWNHYLQTRDLTRLIAGIAPVYATDSNYASLLLRLISMPDVTTCLAELRGTRAA